MNAAWYINGDTLFSWIALPCAFHAGIACVEEFAPVIGYGKGTLFTHVGVSGGIRRIGGCRGIGGRHGIHCNRLRR
ncbi:hypothetical protein SDC9_192945 [bioreactor metagenome]|uniref:Uncharacterized protein n=1 Tax=bioreactor metagenome TaxID=1076179 RepID=A0A645I2B4_9ZZZZ